MSFFDEEEFEKIYKEVEKKSLSSKFLEEIFKAWKKKHPKRTDKDLIVLINLMFEVCHDCEENWNNCQCWNDE